jgi:hypothetical protein
MLHLIRSRRGTKGMFFGVIGGDQKFEYSRRFPLQVVSIYVCGGVTRISIRMDVRRVDVACEVIQAHSRTIDISAHASIYRK